jgi:aminoglycoside phosphotransferase (APT) family kinase protein
MRQFLGRQTTKVYRILSKTGWKGACGALNDCKATTGSPEISDPAIDIEQPEALLTYLRARGILAPEDRPVVRTLAGGVSNRTVLVEGSKRAPFVVKQALSRLRVAVEWCADPERIHREARALEYLCQFAPQGTVPRLLFEDRRRHVIGMSAVPEPHRNWKEVLLEGQICLEHVSQFAALLSAIHSKSSVDSGLAQTEFADRSFFEALRLEPYYRYTAQQVPAAGPFLVQLIEETLAARIALVHGDYSPKNILIYHDRLVLLDHEVAHFGDPAFDVGFSLTHLLSKALHVTSRRHEFLEAARLYVRIYLECLAGMEWRGGLESRAVRHTLGCMLARVAGRSPLEYLTPAEQRGQSRMVLHWIPRHPDRLSELIDAFSEELNCR